MMDVAFRSSRANRSRTFRRQALWAALTMAMGLPYAHAQSAPPQHPDGSTPTGVIQAANGVPVVNIAAPNASGLSHNRFQQFDVDNRGVVLNNSGSVVSTQLAGFIYGNPNLGNGQAARLILNEVTSTLPSQLNGAIEVGGRAADVIVANPNGISCTGCGFINTPRGVLTTGTPILGADGSLQGLHVTGGSIAINGAGLDGSAIDRVDLIARAVAVNAGVWAKQLNVVTGANDVDYSTLAAHNLGTAGAPPAVALDVSAIGGMYAGVIRLVGTEAGLGVNNQGQIAAQSGDLVLSSAGQVTLAGKTTAAGNLSIQAAQALGNSGTLAAGGALSASANGVANGGVVYGGGGVSLGSSGALSNSGQIQAQNGGLTLQANGALSNAAGGDIYGTGAVNLQGASIVNAGALEAGQSLTLASSGALLNRGKAQADAGDLTARAGATLDNSGTVSASGQLRLGATQALGNTGSIVANGAVALAGGSLTNAGAVQGGQGLALTAQGDLVNRGKLYALGGEWTAQAGGALTNESTGDVYGAGAVNLQAASIANAGALEAGQSLTLTSSGALLNSGKAQADAGNLIAKSGATFDNSGTLSATGQLGLSALQALGNSGAVVANGAVTLNGASLGNAGTVQGGQGLALTAQGDLANRGKLYALGGGWSAQVGGAFTNESAGDIYGANDVGLHAGSLSNAGGIEAKQGADLRIDGVFANTGKAQADQIDLIVTAGSLDNGGVLSAIRHLQLQAAQAARNSGVMVSGQNLALSAASFDNRTGGQVQSGADLALGAGGITNAGSLYAKEQGSISGADLSNAAGAQLLADGGLTLAQTGTVSNAGVLQAGADLDLSRATALSNLANATLYAGGALRVAVGGTFTNAGMAYGGTVATLAASDIGNTGVLRSGGHLSASARGSLTSSGAIQAQHDLTLRGDGSLTNSGKLYAIDGALALQAGALQALAGGDIYAGQDIAIGAVSFTHAGTLEAKRGVTIAVQGDASNGGAIQADAGDVTLDAATLRNVGTLSATGNTTLNASRNLTNGGQVVTGQALTLASASIDNGGQAQSGGDTFVQAASVANRGRVQAGGALSFTGNAQLNNQSGGQFLAAGDVSIDTSGQLSNTGVIQAGANLSVAGAGSVDNQAGGTLYGTKQSTLRLGAGLTNAGTLYGGQGVMLEAASLASSGSLRSGADLGVTVRGDAANSGSAYALGNDTWNVGGALSNDGVLAAAGNTKLGAASFAGAGTLAAGLQGDGNLGNTGVLELSSTGALAAHGRNLAGGDITLTGTSIDLSGSQTRAGGNASLTATQGDFNNAGGDLAANGTLSVTTPGALINGGASSAQGGKLSAQTLAFQMGNLVNRYGSISQSGSGDLAWRLAGAIDNAYGRLAVNAGNLTLGATTVDNTGGAILEAGSGTLSIATTGDLNGNGGQIAGNGALNLQAGGTLHNANGSLGAGGDATVRAGAFDNTQGTLAGSNVSLTVSQALTNRSGTVQGTSLGVSAGSLDNTGGFLKGTSATAMNVTVGGALVNGVGGFIGGNGAVTVHGGSLANAGQIYAGSTLSVRGDGSLTNDGGALQALSSLTATSSGGVSNRGGRIEAGAGDGNATLTINGSGLDNTGGRLANAGAGSTTFGIGGNIGNQGGTLGGQGDVTLNANWLDNGGSGHLVAGRNLALGLGSMSNAGGVTYAAGNLDWNNGGATLGNASGAFSAGGNVGLALASIDNNGGDLAAQYNLSLNLGSFGGNGRAVAGQDLSLTLPGDYSNNGGTLKANRDLTLNLGGSFANPYGAALQAVRNLTVNAYNIDNASGGGINSAGTTLNARGTLSNAGRIEGDSITLSALALNNTGTIIGGAITATVGNLTNGADLGNGGPLAADGSNPAGSYQTALIAATNSIDLFVSDTLLNRDASIFTLGNLRIGADAAGNRSHAVTNLSGDIEADGNISLAADQLTNRRRVFQTEQYTLNADEQAANTTQQIAPRYAYNDSNPQHRPPYVDASQVVDAAEFAVAQAYCDSHSFSSDRCIGYPQGRGSPAVFQGTTTYQVTSVTRLASASARGQLLAGGDITLSGSVTNDNSTVAAGRNLIINGQDGNGGGGSANGFIVQNLAFVPTAHVQSTMEQQVQSQHLVTSPSRTWVDAAFWTYGTSSSESDISLAPGAAPAWVTFHPGTGGGAIMSAGQTVSITAHTIDNSNVGADGQPVRNAIGLGQNVGGQAVGGNGPGTVGQVGSGSGSAGNVTLGDGPQATSGGSLGIAQGRGGVDGGNVPQRGSASGAGTAQQGSPSGTDTAPPQVVSWLGGPNPTVSLPQSGLYTVHSEPGSRYLVETDPRFTSYTQFTSSDYMMQKLGFDPSGIRKRLGDGFYEQRSVLDQITALTGRRFLDDNTDAMSQYRSLMDAGVQVAQQYQLSVGVALTPAQVASLTQDIVWMVNATVDGQQVLVPVVYLSAEHARELAAGGATIAGKNVILTADGDITNRGTIAASQNAQLTAANLLNSGSIQAGGNLSVNAAQDILNGGTLKAGGNVSLVAGNDVRSGFNVAQELGAINLGNPGAPVSTVALQGLQPGAISAGGNLSIGAGRDLSLDAAPVAAGGNLSLSAGRDLTATATSISAGRDAQVLAGRDLNLEATGRTTRQTTATGYIETTTHTVSNITAGGALTVAANRDIDSQGAQLKAGDVLAVSAGRDVNLTAVTDSKTTHDQTFEGRTVVKTNTYDETLRGSGLSGSNGVGVSAGRDINATAASLTSDKGNLALAAGHDLNLIAGTENHDSSRDTKTTSGNLISSKTTRTHDATHDSLVVGSNLSGNNVSLVAGNDLTAQAAQVHAEGALNLAAGHDVNLTDAHDVHSEEHDRSVTSTSYISTSSKRWGSVDPEWRSRTDSNSSSQSTSVGTLLSGDSVTVGAGHDINATAAQVAGTHDVILAAGNDLNIQADENTYTESHGSRSSHTGLMNNGGFSVLIGNRTLETSNTVSDTSYTGSIVGSTDGKVTLSAGNNVHITGSDVLSQTGTAIVGKNVTIDAAVGATDMRQTQKMSQAGINVGIGGALAETVQGAYNSAKRGSEVKDDRLKALYAAQAAYQAYDAYNMSGTSLGQGATKPTEGNPGNPNGINLQIGIGGSSASAKAQTHDEQAYGSHIRSQGDVTIAATGGDLTIVGSQVSGQNVALAAKNNLNLLSQTEQHTDTSSNKNASGGIGLQIGTDGIGIYAQAAMGQGKAHGNGTTHAETVIDAKDTLTLISGNDTNIIGAQAKGNTVLASIGGNLNIASQQDTDDYASKQWQAAGKVVIGYSSGGSASYSQGKIESHYASVNEVSGIGAGSGGYQINVGGNTDLKGAVIASTADQSRNLLSTGSLTFSDIQNRASYSASQVGISGGYSSGAGGGFSAMPTMSVPQHEKESSTTRAGIALGTIDVRNSPGQDLTSLDRDPNLNNQALKQVFDQAKVQEKQELGDVAGYVGMHSVGAIANVMYDRASTEAERSAWSDGGINKTILHGLVGAVTTALGGGDIAQGGLGAAASEKASGVMQQYLADHGFTPGTPEFDSMMRFGSAALGGVVGGSSAATALQGEKYNRELDYNEKARIKLLAGGDPQKEVNLNAAACYLVKCYAQYPVGSDQYQVYKALADAGGSDALSSERALLLQQTVPETNGVVLNYGGTTQRSLFGYSSVALAGDSISRANSTYQVGTRVLGGLQAVGGAVDMAGGYLACMTGAGCLAGGALVAYGGDQYQAGANTVWYGSPQPTMGGYLLQQAGVPAQAAEALYGMLGMSPAAIQAIKANKAVDAWVAANAQARAYNTAYAETQASLTQRIGDLRAALPPKLQRSGNMGVAQIDVPGVQSLMAAYSGLQQVTAEQQALGFVGKVPETFVSSTVPLPGGFPLLRDVDSEAKILNNVAAQLGDNPSAKGTINLLTERAPCASCSNVIQQFQAKYPNITINVMDNDGKIITTSRGGL
jgi:filamentous hemagglutinin